MEEMTNTSSPWAKTEFGPIHVEVQRQSSSLTQKRLIELATKKFLEERKIIYNGDVFERCHFNDGILVENVEKVVVTAADQPADRGMVPTKDFINACRIYVYRVVRDEPHLEDIENENDGGEDSMTTAGRRWTLPNVEFEGLWESLIFDSNIKEEVLSYVETMLLFAKRNVDPHVITCNRMLLFHGPPGTGKTTLCKAIAQKLCIRLNDQYTNGRFLEINSHSLFSKYFSESGKLVTKLFSVIHELLDDKSSLLIVLIDEVESLTMARKQALSGNEPSDAIRVVNALLTQIDYIRRWPNVLVLTTSNITEAVDPAFLDRADIRQYVGPPSPSAIYKILYESIIELRRTGIIQNGVALLSTYVTGIGINEQESVKLSKKLTDIACRCNGLSGRTIRKLPLLAHAYKFGAHENITLDKFIDALSYALLKHVVNEKGNLQNGSFMNAIPKGGLLE